MSNDMRKWAVWYEDDTVPAVGVLAKDRGTASEIGGKARPGEVVTAVVAEEEGADIPHDKKELSTLNNPQRFITAVLHDNPPTQTRPETQNKNRDGNVRETKASNTDTSGDGEEEFALKSDEPASDLLNRDDLQ